MIHTYDIQWYISMIHTYDILWYLPMISYGTYLWYPIQLQKAVPNLPKISCWWRRRLDVLCSKGFDIQRKLEQLPHSFMPQFHPTKPTLSLSLYVSHSHFSTRKYITTVVACSRQSEQGHFTWKWFLQSLISDYLKNSLKIYQWQNCIDSQLCDICQNWYGILCDFVTR